MLSAGDRICAALIFALMMFAFQVRQTDIVVVTHFR
jgi:hypothetical protein